MEVELVGRDSDDVAGWPRHDNLVCIALSSVGLQYAPEL